MDSGLQRPTTLDTNQGTGAGMPVTKNEAFERLKEAQEVAFASADQGIIYEESGRRGEALHMYYNARRYLNIGLSIAVDQNCAEWQNAVKIRNELAQIKDNIESRINNLADTGATEGASRCKNQDPGPRGPVVAEPPPPYNEAIALPNNYRPDNTVQNGSDTYDLGVSQPGPVVPSAPSNSVMMQMSARQLVHIPGGVQVFHIAGSGEVSVQSDPTELFIFTLNPAYHPVSQQTVSWLQAGEFTYPLVSGRSPVLKTGYGAYMFPDVSVNGDQTSSVALVFSADVANDLRDLFDQTLRDYARLQEQPQIRAPGEVSFGQKVSDGIVATSGLISRGLVRGAQATSVALSYGADKLRERMTPEQRALAVDPRVQTGLKVARATTHVTCKVTGFVVSAVGDMTCALGKRIAKTLAPAEAVDGVAANGALNDALLIAGGGIAGFGTVFMGLENAARLLAGSITENTVTLVHHKYGESASEVVGDAMYSVGNLALTANNVANLGVRGIAKRTAKETGKAMLEEYARRGPSTYVENAYTVQSPDDEVATNGANAGPSGENSTNTKRS